MRRQTGSIDFETIRSFNNYIQSNNTEKYYYGTCNTVSTDTTKTVSLSSNNFQLSENVIITVYFLNKNEVSNPSLKIQNLEDTKEIRDIFGNPLTASLFKWQDSDIITFKYDGTYWRIQNSNFIEKFSSIQSEIQQWDQHYHSPVIEYGTGSVLDNVTRVANENFTIEIPITTPPRYSAECCTGIMCIQATGTSSEFYKLKGFDFTLVDDTILARTYWQTSNTTTVNNVTISAKASYLKILSFNNTIRLPWANGIQF